MFTEQQINGLMSSLRYALEAELGGPLGADLERVVGEVDAELRALGRRLTDIRLGIEARGGPPTKAERKEIDGLLGRVTALARSEYLRNAISARKAGRESAGGVTGWVSERHGHG